MKLRNTNEIDKQYFNAVLLGFPGSGKTSCIKTLPNLKEVLIANVKYYEDGLGVLSDKDVDVIDIENFEDLASLPEVLSNEKFCDKKHIFFDSISAASKVSIKHFEEETKKSSNAYKKFELHGKFLTSLILDLKRLDKNIIMTAIPDVRKSREGQEVYGFYVDGNMFVKTLEQSVDAILVVGSNSEGKRQLLTQNNGVWIAKLRHPDTVEVPITIDVDLKKKPGTSGLGLLMSKLGYLKEVK